ncbi:unnamed protein product, partial [Didymodactylos carnosus]
MSQDIQIDKDKKVAAAPRLSSSTDRDASSLEQEASKVFVKAKPKTSVTPSVVSVLSRGRSIRSNTSRATPNLSVAGGGVDVNALLLETILESMKLQKEQAKEALEMQTEAIIRVMDKQQSSSRTQILSANTLTAASGDVITVIPGAPKAQVSTASFPAQLLSVTINDSITRFSGKANEQP